MPRLIWKTRNNLFGQIWSKKLKLSVKAEIWYQDWFEYAEVNGGAHLFCFRPKNPFWAYLVQKFKWFIQNKVWFKDQFEYTEFNGGVHFTCLRLEILFFEILKIVILSWKLVPRLIWIWRIRWWCSFFSVFDVEVFLLLEIFSKTQNSKYLKFNGDFLFF